MYEEFFRFIIWCAGAVFHGPTSALKRGGQAQASQPGEVDTGGLARGTAYIEEHEVLGHHVLRGATVTV